MSVSRKDRKQIESLHEMSNSNGPLLQASSSKWQGSPVRIFPPSNEQGRSPRTDMPSANLRKRDNLNPLSAKRIRSTLAPTLGKRSSGSDLRSSHTTTPPLSPVSPSVYPRKKVKIDKKNKVSQGSEIIDLDTERRDTSSPDPLSEYPPTSEAAADDTQSGAVASTSRLPPDGHATQSLKRMLQDTRVSSPIEEFEDDRRKSLPQGTVKRIVSKFENRNLDTTFAGPTIDLRSKIVPVKNKMKPKKPLDTVATSSSNFTYRARSTKNGNDYKLPIKACVIDNMLIGKDDTTGFVLAWDPNGSDLTISCKPDEAVVILDTNGMEYIEYATSTTPTPNFYGMPVLSIQMEGLQPSIRLHRGSSPVYLRPNLVTVMLDSSTNEWSTSLHDAFLNWLRNRAVTTRCCRNGQQMWEMAIRQSNAPEQDQVSRDVTEHKERSIQRALDALSTSEAKSDSNELDRPSADKSDTASDRPFQLRRSSRNVTVTIKKPKPPVDPDEVILVYPQGLPGAINITNADVNRLQPGEFLNDTVIEFGLKLWHKELESSNPEFAKDVHVFSSFFYKKLNKRNFEEGYQSVRKWTSKISLFDKKYIIIPINENLHWYLAIIYRPRYILQPPLSNKATPSPRTRSRSSKANGVECSNSPPDDRLSTAAIPIPETKDQLKSDLDEIQKSCTITFTEDHPTLDVMDIVPNDPEGHDKSCLQQSTNESPMDVDRCDEDAVQEQLRADSIFSDDALSNIDDMAVEQEIPSKQVTSRFFLDTKSVIELDSQGRQTSGEVVPIPGQQQEDIQEEELDSQMLENGDEQGDESGLSPRTYIFTLDSLGTRHLQATRQLNKYLKMEALHKLNNSNTSDAICKAVPVPTQPNFCDCGIYLLHFTRTFMTDPAKYFQTINTSKKSPPANDRKAIWHDDKVGAMRQELSDRIRELSEEWKKTREEAKKDQAETVSDTDSEIEYVEQAPAPTEAKTKTPRGDGKRYKVGKSSRLRG